MSAAVTMIALRDIPLVQPGDDLSALIAAALARAALGLQPQDVLVVASKIVSKAEGRYVALDSVTPSERALVLAAQTQKDPRVVELVLRESKSVSRVAPNVLVVEHRLGFVSANAGIDQSNIEAGDDRVLLLPVDPDASASQLAEQLHALIGIRPAVVISDTHGRPFRLGNIGVAIGVSGMQALVDLRGRDDLFGRKLKISMQGYADMVASAAHLLTGEAGEGLPVVLLRGLTLPQGEGSAHDLNRSAAHDLYR